MAIEEQSALLEKITKQTFRASEIVNSLLNFSRTSGTEFTDVDLNRVIKDTLSLLEHQFKTARVKVQADLYHELPPIHGNTGKLQQVFLNLFLNAKDAMPGGGTLTSAPTTATMCRSRSPTPAPASRRNTFIAFTIRSSPPRQAQDGPQRRHRSGPFGDLRHHSGTRRQDPGR